MAWKALDGLSDSAYYEIASPGGSRGTVDVGTVHLAAWVTIRPTVTSKTRRIVGTEGNSGTSPYGLTLMTTGTNGTLAARIRGVNPGGLVLTATYALSTTQLNRPLYVVARVGGGFLDLFVDGVAVDSRTIAGTGYFAVSTAPLSLGRRPEVTGDSVTGEIAIHGVSSGNTTPLDAAVTTAFTAGLAAEDIVAIGGSDTEHLWSAKQDGGANATLLDRVGTDHLVRTGTPLYFEPWAAFDELSDTNYYEMATGGNRGTQNTGDTYAQAWVTLEPTSVSKVRRIYSTEGSTSSTPYGITLMTTGTNGTVVVRSRGPTGVVSSYYAVQASDYGRPIHVLGAIGGGLVSLWKDGSLSDDSPLPGTGYYDVSTTPIAIGRRPTGTGTTGDSVDGAIKVHGVATGDYAMTVGEAAAAYLAGLGLSDIAAIPSKTDHLWSARQEGSAASTLTDQVGSDDMTRAGTVSYVSPFIDVATVATVDPPDGAATLAQAQAGAVAASMGELGASASVEVGAGLVIVASIDGPTASATAFASGNPRTVYAPLGTTYTFDTGEVIPDSGRVISYDQDIRRKLMQGFVRTDNARNYPVVDAQTITLTASASMGLTASAGPFLIGTNVAVDASLPLFTASAELTMPNEVALVSSSVVGLTASASVTVGASGVIRPFGVGSHWNERTKYAQLAAAGVQNIRIDIAWYHVEANQGTFTWDAIDDAMDEAAARGIIVHAVLGYTNNWATSGPGQSDANKYAPLEIYDDEFAAYIQATASRYASAVGSWEIWNEPDHNSFLKLGTGCWARNNYGGETAVNQKRLQYRRIQELALAQPALAGKVITTSGLAEGGNHDAGFRTYLQGVPGFFGPYAIGNFHCYGYPSYQRLIDSPSNWRATGNAVGKGSSWPLWITEHGINTTGVANATVKTYLIRSYATALAQAQVKGLWWFRAGYDPDHMDLFDAANNTTAAYAAYQTLTSRWTGATAFASWSSGTARGTIAARSGTTSMAIIWADSSGAAISSYGLSILNVWNQDGTSISSSTTLGAAPVFVELNDAPTGNVMVDRAANTVVDRATNTVVARV
jgi:hypothetical protein